MENKQTSAEALAAVLRGTRSLFVRGSNWDKQANHIIARNILDAELGRYADELPVYHFDQETRDRLLVHARQDAAEALCNTTSLMNDVHQLKSALRELRFTIWVSVAIYCLWLWAKSGFVMTWLPH